MERRLDQDLDRIRQSLLRMGGMVEEMVARATRALAHLYRLLQGNEALPGRGR
jgi:phosphate uptake regulator